MSQPIDRKVLMGAGAIAGIALIAALVFFSGSDEPVAVDDPQRPVERSEEAASAEPAPTTPETAEAPGQDQVASVPAPDRAVDVELLEDRFIGDPNAPVEVIEYASLTCPHCADFHAQTFPILKERYVDTGLVRFVYRDFALDRPGAMAAMMARCVPEQGYFSVIDVLFRTQRTWSRADTPEVPLAQIAAQAGLDAEGFNACLSDQALLDGILRFRQDATDRFEITGTPSFVVNGEEVIRGNRNIADFEAAIEKYLP